MAGSKVITAYIDVASFYSYLAFLRLEKDRAALESHGVEIDYVPVFLGGINHGSGNQPPWTLPAKGAYSKYESARAKKYFGATYLGMPKPFPQVTLLPMRCMGYVKATFGVRRWEETFPVLCEAVWTEEKDSSKPEDLRSILVRLFTEVETDEILQAGQSAQWKETLKNNTQQALERGAFGAPWFWVKNAKGVEEPFFGSDRMHMIWDLLELPWTDIALQPKL